METRGKALVQGKRISKAIDSKDFRLRWGRAMAANTRSIKQSSIAARLDFCLRLCLLEPSIERIDGKAT